jgi:environmental stress-induced protein Ves
VSRWRNGAGRKADIAAGADWLVGFAWLDADAPFSDYAGHDRPSRSSKVRASLDFGSAHPALLAGARSCPQPRRRLAGALPGARRPCVVLNAMTARAAWTHRVAVTTGSERAAPAPGGVAFLVVLEGSVSIDGQTAGPRDAFRVEEAVAFDGDAAARVALIGIDPVTPPA